MRPCTTALSFFLNSAANLECVQVDLYTFVLSSGEILRYSGGNTALSFAAAAFPSSPHNSAGPTTFALGPRFGRSKITTKIGVQPAELDIDILAGAGDRVGTFTWADAVRLGIFDGAEVELDRFFAPAQTLGSGVLDTSLGCITWFLGRVADTDIGRSRIAMKVKSLMNLLAIQQMPRRLYGASCAHIFGDQMCGYDRVGGRNALGVATGNGAFTYTADTSSTQSQITATVSVNSIVTEGTMTGTTGANTGYSRTVFSLAGNTMSLKKPFLFPVAAGDTFTVLPGCDHTTATCNGTYQNIMRFGGFPYIPPPEYAV